MIENPKVSIGLPVYNAERFLPLALDGLLSQTFGNFELIISDNASTDGTREICEARAGEDDRIRYDRNDRNIGASRNFNRTFQLARAPYFKWAAADDLCEPALVEKCLEQLEQDPDAVLTYPWADAVDENGEKVEGLDPGGYLDLTSDDPRERFHQLMRLFESAAQRVSGWKGLYLFGVLRSDALRRTKLLGSFIGCDAALIVQLILLGKFREVPECLLFMRRHEESFSAPTTPLPEKHKFFNPKTRRKSTMQLWRKYKEFSFAILRSPIPMGDKASLLDFVAREAFRLRRDLRTELVETVEQKLGRGSPGA